MKKYVFLGPILGLGIAASVATPILLSQKASQNRMVLNKNEEMQFVNEIYDQSSYDELFRLFLNPVELNKITDINKEEVLTFLESSKSYSEFVQWVSKLDSKQIINSKKIISQISNLDLSLEQKQMVLSIYQTNLTSYITEMSRTKELNNSSAIYNSVTNENNEEAKNISSTPASPTTDLQKPSSFISLNIPGYETVKLFYNPAKGYQVVDMTENPRTLKVFSKDGTLKSNEFILNGDVIEINEANIKTQTTVAGLTNLFYIPNALQGNVHNFNASNFINDKYTDFSIVRNSSATTSSVTVISTNKVLGYDIPETLKRISYLDNTTSKIVTGSIHNAPGHPDMAVGFDSSFSHPAHDTAWSEVSTNLQSSDLLTGTEVSKINGDMDIESISVFSNFSDEGANRFQYQKREVKSYEITSYDQDNKVVKTIEKQNANLGNVLFDALPSGASMGWNIAEFIVSVASVAIPVASEFALGATLMNALKLGLTSLTVQYGIPAIADTFLGQNPLGALYALGYNVPNSDNSRLQIVNYISSVFGNLVTLGGFPRSLSSGVEAILQANGEPVSLGASLLTQIKDASSSASTAFGLLQIPEQSQNTPHISFTKFDSSNKTELSNYWEKANQNINTSASMEQFNKYKIEIKTPGLTVPFGGHIFVKAIYTNIAAAAFHTTLFHWWSHSWGHFKYNEKPQFVFNGKEHIVSVNSTKDIENQNVDINWIDATNYIKNNLLSSAFKGKQIQISKDGVDWTTVEVSDIVNGRIYSHSSSHYHVANMSYQNGKYTYELRHAGGGENWEVKYFKIPSTCSDLIAEYIDIPDFEVHNFTNADVNKTVRYSSDGVFWRTRIIRGVEDGKLIYSVSGSFYNEVLRWNTEKSVYIHSASDIGGNHSEEVIRYMQIQR